MSFRAGTEDAETAEVKIKKIRAGIDATQSTIELEIIALILLDKAARKHNLKNISTQAMLDTAADIGLVLLIGKRRADLAHWMEAVGLHVSAVHLTEDVIDGSLSGLP